MHGAQTAALQRTTTAVPSRSCPLNRGSEPKNVVDVTLKAAGKYRYSLWVTDDEGAVSALASVTLKVVASSMSR
jgi:hypothetical protein